ncbi:MAG: SDR family oxidoreductase [Isosphaeraceae bacterium]|nr:SDR family oxidoreductase [Isosphaeraceae bacterium]
MPCSVIASTAARGSTRMRAIVIGGSGQIGGWLLRVLTERGHEAIGTYANTPFSGLVHLDAADLAAAAAWLRSQRPEVVFYPAGFTWVDGCERDPETARSANRDQPLNLARAAADLGARFVYYSTDYLFDGQAGPYAEEAPPCPLNVYGRAKLEAEHALAEALGDRLLILRTCWVYGPERQGKNFAYQVAQALSVGKPVVCPSDQSATPSYGPDVARASVLLVEGGQVGVIHVAGPETMDRPTFARRIALGFGLDPGLILAQPTAELGQETPRPLASGLRTPKLDALWPGLMRPMTDCLKDFRARLAAGEGWARGAFPETDLGPAPEVGYDTKGLDGSVRTT